MTVVACTNLTSWAVATWIILCGVAAIITAKKGIH